MAGTTPALESAGAASSNGRGVQPSEADGTDAVKAAAISHPSGAALLPGQTGEIEENLLVDDTGDWQLRAVPGLSSKALPVAVVGPQSAPSRAPAGARNGSAKPSRLDALVLYTAGHDALGRCTSARAAAAALGLQELGLGACEQSSLAGHVDSRIGNSDEAQLVVQAAKNSTCAVLLLTLSFIERVERSAFGDPCVAAFTMALCMSNVVTAVMEPELVNPTQWGWNRVFARLSGRPVLDLSMDHRSQEWVAALEKLAWHINPRIVPRPEATLSLDVEVPYREAASTPAAPLPMLEDAGLPTYHCYVSHDLGQDQVERDNHARVCRIVQLMRRHGLRIFMDSGSWDLHRYASEDEALVDGARRSSACLMFLTRGYIDAVEGGSASSRCVAQFNLSKLTQNIIPVVMEPQLQRQQNWGWNRIYAHLSRKLPVDLSGEDGGLLSMYVNPEVQRWMCAIDFLEMKIWQSVAGASSNDMLKHPLPFIPWRDTVVHLGACFILGGLLYTVAAGLKEVSDSVSDGLVIASGLLLAVGFALLAFWHVQKARIPKAFEISSEFLPTLALVGAGLRCAGALILIVRPLTDMLLTDAVDIDVVGSGSLLAGSLVGVLDGVMHHCQRGPCSFWSFPAWADLLFLLAAALLLLAHLISDLEDLAMVGGMVGGLVLCLAGLTYLAWVAFSGRLLRRYGHGEQSRRACGAQAKSPGTAPKVAFVTPADVQNVLREATIPEPAEVLTPPEARIVQTLD